MSQEQLDYDAARRGAAPVAYMVIVLLPLALCACCGLWWRLMQCATC